MQRKGSPKHTTTDFRMATGTVTIQQSTHLRLRPSLQQPLGEN